jgi:PEP-CTERM motif
MKSHSQEMMSSNCRGPRDSWLGMVLLSFLSITALSGTASAGTGSGIPCGSAPGLVHELSYNRANFVVRITGPDGKVLNPQPAGFPFNANGVPLAGGGYGANVAIPAFNFACDVKNTTIQLRQKGPTLPGSAGTLSQNGGEESDLSLESVFFDPVTHTYSLQDLFGTIQHDLGKYVEVAIPDLYADTNGDGSLGAGDVLYSLVDMNFYLKSIPTFTPGEAFSIVNGKVAGLPGMLFSTTEFTFDGATGFAGTDYTGVGIVESEHVLEAVPEPSSLLLLGSGILGLSGFLRKRLLT